MMSQNKAFNLFYKLALSVLLFVLFAAQNAFAAVSSVQATARVIPEKARLGDEIRLFVQVDRPKKYVLFPPSEKIDLAPFEVKKVELSPYVSGKNRVCETFILTLTVFQLGDLTVPPVRIQFQDHKGVRGEVKTEPVTVKIVSVGKKPADKDDIRSIKGPVASGFAGARNWLLGSVAAILAVWLVVIVVRRLRKKFIDPESLKPPHERARLELERLKKQGFIEQHKTKEFYSGLSDILRRYLERQFGTETLERTTAEVVSALKEKTLDPEALEDIRKVLENSDLVKFAKYDPERSVTDELEKRLLNAVDRTRPVPPKEDRP